MNVKQELVSQIKRREQALDILLPKILGILWKAKPSSLGPPKDPSDTRLRIGGVSKEIAADLVIGGTPLPSGYMIHAYVRSTDWVKVFSAHLTDVVLGDRKTFKYWDGRCAVLSWRRGVLEDRICAEPDEPRSWAHVNTAGLSRQKA